MARKRTLKAKEDVPIMMPEQEPQPIYFQYSVKIERSAKGARWAVHCYGNNKETAMNEAVEMYDQVGKKLEAEGYSIAPIDSGGRIEAQ